MQAVTTLLICAAVCSLAVSQDEVLPTVSPQTETSTPQTQKCTTEDLVGYITTLPNPAMCGPGLGTVFVPPNNDTAALKDALENVCNDDCGGQYTTYLTSVCDDGFGSESLQLYCTPTNGTATVGPYCRYAIGDILNSSILTDLFACDNYTEENPCSLGCRAALNQLKDAVGCCYQNVYNNTAYNRELLRAGFITTSEFIGLEQHNDPTASPWLACDIEPPKRCSPPPFKPPPPAPKCTLEDKGGYLSTLPNAAVCGPSIGTVFLPPLNDSTALSNALENVCTNECGGEYSNYLETVCGDNFEAISLRLHCTPTNGTATVGPYCRYAIGDILNSSILTDLFACENYTEENPCSFGCRAALNQLKASVGCCYQNVYNNTAYNRELLRAGFITTSEFIGFEQLNDPTASPWLACDIEPPKRCSPPPFKPPPPAPKCTLEDKGGYLSTLPNAAICGPSIGTVFLPPLNDSTTLSNALENVCTNECGGEYSNYLETVCGDNFEAISLRLYCTPTNGTATVGPYCRYAIGDILNSSLLTDLFACDNYTEENPCSLGCRAALNQLKDAVGCCYQNVYNNTAYNRELLRAGFITTSEFIGLEQHNDPTASPWLACDIEPPKRCSPPPFKPPPPAPKCTLEDKGGYLSTLPNAAICGPSIGTVFLPPLNDSTALSNALENVCTNECGGEYSNYLETVCGDNFEAVSLRLHCTPTNGTATVGPYCHYAIGDILNSSILTDLFACENYTEENPCSFGCRAALNQLKASVGCCYQNVYNNTAYNRELLRAGFITTSEFIGFEQLNDPTASPWLACDIEPPKRCSPPPFKPPPPAPKCTLEDKGGYLSTLPNAAICGPSIGTVFLPPLNDSTALSNALENVCTNECGGEYSNYLETVCGDNFEAISLRLYCTPTNGTATVGPYCRYAIGDILNSSLLTDLFACDNYTEENPCSRGCRAALNRLKDAVGCCYQNVYNNTAYNRELLRAGFITTSEFIGLEQHNDPTASPWLACDIEPPKRCSPPPFKPPPPAPKCTLEDKGGYLSTLPNAAVCGPSIGTVFLPPLNDSIALSNALENVCTNECGGEYSNYLETVCGDNFEAISLRLHCTPTNGTATVGPYCRYAIGDILNSSLLTDLFACDNYTEENPCSRGCRAALNRFKDAVGCCYQNVYNNTAYNRELLRAGFITTSEFTGFEQLNDPTASPWLACDIEPPKRCSPPPFKPPPPAPKCTLEDKGGYLSTLPNAAVCGPSIGTVFLPPLNDSTALSNALENVCTNECGGEYSNYLETVCGDNFEAISLRLHCTPTNGTATVGPYCRYAIGDILNSSLLTDLFACDNYTEENPCSRGCRAALNRLKDAVGCCYQNVYNNTAYNRELLRAGFITTSEFTGFEQLNDPTASPWLACDIEPPKRCSPPPFKPPPPAPKCTLEDKGGYLSTLPNAAVCGLSIGTVFLPPLNDSTALSNTLENVCTNECGGEYSNYLETVCGDNFEAISLRLHCTPTNGTATVGPYCRYAIGDILNSSLLTDLFACDNYTEENPCSRGCRAALNRLKVAVGCCYQNVYNNTAYNRELLRAGFITTSEFTGFEQLNDPTASPWLACDIEPPKRCSPPPFKPPPPAPKCTLEDKGGYLSTLPNAAVCGPSIGTVFLPPLNDSTALSNALENVCTNECGGEYSNYLETVCRDNFEATLLRLHCTPTNERATVGPYCRYAMLDILNSSIFTNLFACDNYTNENPCSRGCRAALNRLKDAVGCCYQNVYNNTAYNRELLRTGFITTSEFVGLQQLNNPTANPWLACNVKVPDRCSAEPFGCPRGSYQQNRTCQPCPANTDISKSGGNATICPCLRGFFRTSNERASDMCSSPPTSCRNIQVKEKQDKSLTLVWTKPVDTGRNDFYYQIKYSDGETTAYHSLVNRTDTVQTMVSGLTPDTCYTFTVTVHNGVSRLDERNEYLRRCELTTTTREGTPSEPVGVRGFCSAVGWKLPRNPNGRITGYDIRLSTDGDDAQITHLSTGSEGTFIAIEERYQQEGTVVEVRGRTASRVGDWSEETPLGCTETSPSTCPPCDCTTPEPTPAPSVYFSLGGEMYGNNSVAPLARVGESDNALLCVTNNVDCCGTLPNRFGEFYYPSGEKVPINAAGDDFYRNRGDQRIALNRRVGTTSPTGKFRCEIRDANGDVQNIYINLVT